MYAPGAPGAASSGPVSSASSVVRAKPHVSSRYEYEGLDVPNFEDTPWEKPSLERVSAEEGRGPRGYAFWCFALVPAMGRCLRLLYFYVLRSVCVHVCVLGQRKWCCRGYDHL